MDKPCPKDPNTSTLAAGQRRFTTARTAFTTIVPYETMWSSGTELRSFVEVCQTMRARDASVGLVFNHTTGERLSTTDWAKHVSSVIADFRVREARPTGILGFRSALATAVDTRGAQGTETPTHSCDNVVVHRLEKKPDFCLPSLISARNCDTAWLYCRRATLSPPQLLLCILLSSRKNL